MREIKRVHICTLPTDIVTPRTDTTELSQLTIYTALNLSLCPLSILCCLHSVLVCVCVCVHVKQREGNTEEKAKDLI